MLSIQNRIAVNSVSEGGIVTTPPLIATQKYEWYMQNALATTPSVLAYDTGNLNAKLDLINPALANKPTASTIGTKISYSADGTDDYLYRAYTNFMRSMPTWMVTVVFKYDSSTINMLLNMSNETNPNRESVRFFTNTSNRLQLQVWNSSGVLVTNLSSPVFLVNGNNYIVTFGWGGTNFRFFNEATNIYSTIVSNPLLGVTQTDNIVTMAEIKPANGNLFWKGNIGYIGVNEYNETILAANVATLKTTFGI